jgi:hypothetical protein
MISIWENFDTVYALNITMNLWLKLLQGGEINDITRQEE